MNDNEVVFMDDFRRKKSQQRKAAPAFTWFNDGRLRHPSCNYLVRQIVAATLDKVKVDPKTLEYEIHAPVYSNFTKQDLERAHLTRDLLEMRVRMTLVQILDYIPSQVIYLDELPEGKDTDPSDDTITLVIRLR